MTMMSTEYTNQQVELINKVKKIITDVENAGYEVSHTNVDGVIQCIAGQILTATHDAVAKEILYLTTGDPGVLNELSKSAHFDYKDDETKNMFFMFMAQRNQLSQTQTQLQEVQQSDGNVLSEDQIEAMAEDAIKECIIANAPKKVPIGVIVGMLNYWSAMNVNGRTQLRLVFNDGTEVRIDKNFQNLDMYLAKYHLTFDSKGVPNPRAMYEILLAIAKNKYKPFSYENSPEFADLLRRTIIDALNPINTDVFCTCDSVPPKIYVRQSYFLREIANRVATDLVIQEQDVPKYFVKWGIFLSEESDKRKVPKCIAEKLNTTEVSSGWYYEVDIEKLAEITHVEKDNICPQENKGEGEGGDGSQSGNENAG
nr:MAG: hypothetical protein TU36_02300 [Vulcanisaeta sp. AZ3]